MCACGTPNVNGEPGYRWQPNDVPSTRPISAPALLDSDVLVFDEPGRCGGLDAHCHHFRLVLTFGAAWLVWRHGGGEGRCRISGGRMVIATLRALDAGTRYWMLHALFHAHNDGRQLGHDQADATWSQAALDKRIKVSPRRAGCSVTVRIVSVSEQAARAERRTGGVA